MITWKEKSFKNSLIILQQVFNFTQLSSTCTDRRYLHHCIIRSTELFYSFDMKRVYQSCIEYGFFLTTRTPHISDTLRGESTRWREGRSRRRRDAGLDEWGVCKLAIYRAHASDHVFGDSIGCLRDVISDIGAKIFCQTYHTRGWTMSILFIYQR